MKTKFFLFAGLFLIFSAAVFAQNVSGRYEGFADVQPYGKLPISAEMREKNGKVSGAINTPLGTATIIEGAFDGAILKLTIDAGGDDIAFNGKFAGGKLSGEVSGDSIKGIFELTRTGDAAPEADLSYIYSQNKEKWREDLRFIAGEIPTRHKNAFHFTTRENFEKAVADLDAQIPSLDDSQILFGFAKIFAMIGDGHSFFNWTWAFGRVPVRFFRFGKDLRVVAVDKKFDRANGAKVVRIGNVPIEEIFRRSQEYISQDETPQFVLEASANFLTFPAFLKQIGAASLNDKAVFEFLDEKNKKFSLEIAVDSSEKTAWIYPYKTAPLWLENRDKPLAYKFLPASKTVYVQFQSYPRRKEFRKFSDELFAFLDKTQPEKIVFDLRSNGGGDFTRGRDFFIKQLKTRPQFTKKGKLFVIAGRRTFSAGMSNAADFRNEFGAILVGEPSGQKPNGYSENRYFKLPNSHIDFSVSIDFYKFAATDTPGLIPDKMFEPDWQSFKAGRDSALEWILKQPVVK